MERDILELDFGPTPDRLREEYWDMYEGIQPEILNTKRFDENLDLSTTYLGRQTNPKTARLKQRSLSPYQSKGIP